MRREDDAGVDLEFASFGVAEDFQMDSREFSWFAAIWIGRIVPGLADRSLCSAPKFPPFRISLPVNTGNDQNPIALHLEGEASGRRLTPARRISECTRFESRGDFARWPRPRASRLTQIARQGQDESFCGGRANSPGLHSLPVGGQPAASLHLKQGRPDLLARNDLIGVGLVMAHAIVPCPARTC